MYEIAMLSLCAVLGGAVAFWAMYRLIIPTSRLQLAPNIPLAARPGEAPVRSWMLHGRELVKSYSEKRCGPFQVMTPTGPKIILPNRYVREVGYSPLFDLPKAFSVDFNPDLPGFEPHKQAVEDGPLIEDTIKIKMMQDLDLLTDPVVDETTASLEDVFGDHEHWHRVTLRQCMHEIFTRLSSRVLVGNSLCRNKRWLEIAKNYYWTSFTAAYKIQLAPPILRYVACYLIPECRTIRAMLNDAKTLLDPEVEIRKAKHLSSRLGSGNADREGNAPFTRRRHGLSFHFPDAITWLIALARETNRQKLDYVAAQLALTGAAYTPTDVCGQLLVHLCQFPEIVPPLRQEIIQVIGENGWSKASLYKLKLMDSFMRESQRYSPRQTTSLNRYVLEDFRLSDGTLLPKDSRIKVCTNFDDPAVYADPEKFDAFRFARLREGKQGLQEQQEDAQKVEGEGKWQFSASTPEWMLFSFGSHNCPGRFFAANEIKIALSHLILKYDWRFKDEGNMGSANGNSGMGSVPQLQYIDTGMKIGPGFELECRRRSEEVVLDL